MSCKLGAQQISRSSPAETLNALGKLELTEQHFLN